MDYVLPNNPQGDQMHRIPVLIQICSCDFLKINYDVVVISYHWISLLTKIATKYSITSEISVILWATHIFSLKICAANEFQKICLKLFKFYSKNEKERLATYIYYSIRMKLVFFCSLRKTFSFLRMSVRIYLSSTFYKLLMHFVIIGSHSFDFNLMRKICVAQTRKKGESAAAVTVHSLNSS